MKKMDFFNEKHTRDGVMIFNKNLDGMRTMDFVSMEGDLVAPFTMKCKVKVDSRGWIEVTELPKHVRNTPIFRGDNSSLSLGRNKRYYFVFTLPEEELEVLPQTLIHEATTIAEKMHNEMLEKDNINNQNR